MPHRVTEEQGPEGPATVMWLHRSRSWLGVATMSLISGALIAGTVAMFVTDEPEGGWVLAVLAVLFTSFVPDSVRALVRRPRLTLTPSGLSYRGQAVDAAVDWDDVRSVGGQGNDRGGILLVHPREGAGRARAGRIIWRFEDKPFGAEMAITSNEPRDAELFGPVLAWMEEYWRQPGRRSELGTPAARERLDHLRRVSGPPG